MTVSPSGWQPSPWEGPTWPAFITTSGTSTIDDTVEISTGPDRYDWVTLALRAASLAVLVAIWRKL